MSVSKQVLKRLFAKPLPSSRAGAFYNTFPYQTKISPESIGVYIATITEPGDTVVDTFGGSGSTAVAALLCERPTEAMKRLAQDMGVVPKWGPRNAILYDVGSYGSFASRTMTSRLSAEQYRAAVDDFMNKATALTEGIYDAIDPHGDKGTLRYALWSEYIRCPKCGREISYFEGGTSRNPVVFKDVVTCPFCDGKFHVDDAEPVLETVHDRLIDKDIKRTKRCLVWVYGQTGKWKWDRPAQKSDELTFAQAEAMGFDKHDEPRAIKWGDLWRAGYHTGITHLHHFYTHRNYIVMDRLWRLASSYPRDIANALRLLLLSYNASHCTLMTRVVAKKNSKDFVLTGAQSGVLYISRIPVEKNILSGLRRKSKPFCEVFGLLEKCKGRVRVNNASSERLHEADASVDYVFTDPPFGDFIPYAEVNQINELWLPRVTNRSEELIISPAQGKSVGTYGEMLGKVFSEISRVIKPRGFATIVFHAAKAEVWNAFAKAIGGSGMSIHETTILDKKQSSFKQVVSPDSVQGDPMLLLKKCDRALKSREVSQDVILDELVASIDEAGEVDERRVYSLYVNRCLAAGAQIELDAKEAYRRIEERVMKGKNA